MSRREQLKLLTNFEVKHLAHTITEYSACRYESSSYFALLVFLWQVYWLSITAVTICSCGIIFLWPSRIAITLIGIVDFVALIFTLHECVVDETVTLIQQFGVQFKWRYAIGRETIKFIERDRIETVFVHEYISGSEIHFALAFIVLGCPKLLLIFQEVYPGYNALKKVYQACAGEVS